MSTTIVFPDRFAQIVVDEVVYKADKHGLVVVDNSDHVEAIVRMGGTIPDKIIRAAKVAPPPSKKPEKVEAPVVEEVAVEDAADEEFAPVDEADENATLEIDGSEVPTEAMTRPKMIEWLRENGVAVNAAISKTDAWKAIQAVLEKGN